jgi:hypothetical protein
MGTGGINQSRHPDGLRRYQDESKGNEGHSSQIVARVGNELEINWVILDIISWIIKAGY